MQPFETAESEYQQSIAADTSVTNGISVTTVVRADRNEELEILDSIYSAAEGLSFYPFRDKSHDLHYSDSVPFFEEVVEQNLSRLNTVVHLGQDGSDQERVEAVQTAILVRQLEPQDELVILDGATDKADRFGRAYDGISTTIPPLTTCIESEIYYPSSLLADIASSHLAAQIDHPRHTTEVTPKTPIAKEEFNAKWGKAYDSMVTGSTEISLASIPHRRAETVRTRMHCWFNGCMGGGEPYPTDKSVRQIVNYAERQGYDELAAKLSEV